jgi:hypothetical protein
MRWSIASVSRIDRFGIGSSPYKGNGGGGAGRRYFVEKLGVRRMPDSYCELSDA